MKINIVRFPWLSAVSLEKDFFLKIAVWKNCYCNKVPHLPQKDNTNAKNVKNISCMYLFCNRRKMYMGFWIQTAPLTSTVLNGNWSSFAYLSRNLIAASEGKQTLQTVYICLLSILSFKNAQLSVFQLNSPN